MGASTSTVPDIALCAPRLQQCAPAVQCCSVALGSASEHSLAPPVRPVKSMSMDLQAGFGDDCNVPVPYEGGEVYANSASTTSTRCTNSPDQSVVDGRQDSRSRGNSSLEAVDIVCNEDKNSSALGMSAAPDSAAVVGYLLAGSSGKCKAENSADSQRDEDCECQPCPPPPPESSLESQRCKGDDGCVSDQGGLGENEAPDCQEDKNSQVVNSSMGGVGPTAAEREWLARLRAGSRTSIGSVSDQYDGDFVDGKRHGLGVLLKSNGSRFQGEFSMGKFHGKGHFRATNGNIYEGQWQLNLPEGSGTYTAVDGSTYEGEWLAGDKSGKGLEKLANGDEYQGYFAANKKHGAGVYKANKGFTFAGQFVDDLMHGTGCYKFADGRAYVGRFDRGKMMGKGDNKGAAGQGSPSRDAHPVAQQGYPSNKNLN